MAVAYTVAPHDGHSVVGGLPLAANCFETFLLSEELAALTSAGDGLSTLGEVLEVPFAARRFRISVRSATVRLILKYQHTISRHTSKMITAITANKTRLPTTVPAILSMTVYLPVWLVTD